MVHNMKAIEAEMTRLVEENEEVEGASAMKRQGLLLVAVADSEILSSHLSNFSRHHQERELMRLVNGAESRVSATSYDRKSDWIAASTSEEGLIERFKATPSHHMQHMWLLRLPLAGAKTYDYVYSVIGDDPRRADRSSTSVDSQSTEAVKARYMELNPKGALWRLSRDTKLIPEAMLRAASFFSASLAIQYIDVHGFKEEYLNVWAKLINASERERSNDERELAHMLRKVTTNQEFLAKHSR